MSNLLQEKRKMDNEVATTSESQELKRVKTTTSEMNEKSEKVISVSTEWFSNWIGKENFNHTWTCSGSICWTDINWFGAGESENLSDYLPQCGADVPRWICAVARRSKPYHYGSYELQIVLSALVSRPQHDVSVEDVKNAIKGCPDLIGNELVPCYDHGHWKTNIGDLMLDAIDKKIVMNNGVNDRGPTPSLMFHSFYGEYSFNGIRNDECSGGRGRGCRLVSEEDYRAVFLEEREKRAQKTQ